MLLISSQGPEIHFDLGHRLLELAPALATGGRAIGPSDKSIGTALRASARSISPAIGVEEPNRATLWCIVAD